MHTDKIFGLSALIGVHRRFQNLRFYLCSSVFICGSKILVS